MSEAVEIEREAVPRPPNHYTEPEFVTVEGVPTAYRRKGAGEPVLFLHGAGATRMWMPFYEECASAVDFIAPEHPGFGETPMPPWLKDFTDVVIHYDGFLETLGIGDLHLIGYSLGGWMASEIAAFYPRRMKSLTLITPIGLRLEDDPGVDIFKIPPEELVDRLYNDKSKMGEYLTDATDLEEALQLMAEASSAARLIWAPRYNLALERRLRRLSCPTLVVGAENDRLVPNAMAERFAEVLPGARLERVPETGHAIIAERPAETAAVILRFIEGASS